jgi:PAS domain-containing protein
MDFQSDIKTITDKLNTLEGKFNAALDAAEVGIWEWDFATNELIYDNRMMDLYELPRSSKVNYELWRNLVHPEDLPGVEAKIKDCIEHNKPYIYWFRIKSNTNPSGWKYIKGKGRVIRDESNKIIGMNGVNLESDCPEEFIKFNSNSSK